MANLPVLIEDLPHCIPRPVQWARLLRNLKALHDGDPAKILDAAYAVGDAIGGLSEERQLRRILATPEGQELWARGSSLTDALANHDALARLPDGSLGRAFITVDPRQLARRCVGAVGPSRSFHNGVRSPALVFDSLTLDR